MKNPPNKGAALRKRGPARSPLAQPAFAAGVLNDLLPVAVLYFLGSTMIDANLEWVAISRLGPDESAGDGWLKAIHPDDRAIASQCIATASCRPDNELSVRVVGRDGSANWFRGHLRCFDDPDGEARLLTLTAVGAHRSNEARLLYMSSHDGMTGLANRAGFIGEVTRTFNAGIDLAGMLFIDLDHFKAVNDHLGHRFGDAVISGVCRRIESAIRSTDLAGRLGGDEIGVFCPNLTSTSEMFSVADRIGEALATPFMIEAQMVIVGASVGVSFRSDSCRTAEALIDSADRAMYVAKNAGGGRWATLDARGTPRTGDPRSAQLRSALGGEQAIAQAVGMIMQRFGAHAIESEGLLRSYARASDMAVVNAARMVVEREVDIDTLELGGVVGFGSEPPVAASDQSSPSTPQHRGTHES